MFEEAGEPFVLPFEVFGTLSMGRRRSSGALRFGGGMNVGVLTGSPEMEARRSPICNIVSAMTHEEQEGSQHTPILKACRGDST